MQRLMGLMKRAATGAFLMSVFLFAPLNAQDQTVGLFVCDSAAYDGYTLFSPMRATTTYLIDMYGRLVHSWENSYPPGNSVYLLQNGHLLRPARPTPGGGGLIQEVAWDGTILWDFSYFTSDYRQHHDVEPLPNGNVLLLAWEYKTKAEAFAAGRDTALLSDDELWPEHVVEIEPAGPTGGNIVWEWHLWDHLVQDYDSTKDNYGVVAEHPELVDINFVLHRQDDWIHANAVDYSPELDQIIICSRTLGEFWVIDHSTTTAEATGHTGGNSGMGGDILYRWGNPQGYDAGTADDQKLFLQHDAQWIEPGCPGEGNILVFNNGGLRMYSSVDEIEPPVDDSGHYPQPPPGTAHDPAEASWIYVADPPGEFYSSIISGAQRLANGNTLICSGVGGDFFEVTSESEIVWEYINPVNNQGPVAQGDELGNNNVFRCYRYPPDYPGLQGHDLTPGGPIELYPVSISGTSHSPSAPSANDSVVVTAVIADDSGIAVAELYVDTGSGFFALMMFDDGNHHDGLAGDSLFGAIVPPLPESTLALYYVYAEDSTGSSTNDPPNPPTTTYSYIVGYSSPKIYINEFLAGNFSCCTDDHDEYDDWIELYNAEDHDVYLTGMYLTDDLSDPAKFLIGDTVIPAGGFLVFWADDQTAQGSTHTNFELELSGEEIGLFDSDVHGNQPIDTLNYSEQETDISYGRLPDGSDNWTSFDTPTPSAANRSFICGDVDANGAGPNIGDLTYLVDYLFRGGPPPPVPEAANVDGDNGVNVADLTYMVDYLFRGGPAPICGPIE